VRHQRGSWSVGCTRLSWLDVPVRTTSSTPFFHRHTSDENVPLKEPFISLSLSSTDNVARTGRDMFTNKFRMEGVAMQRLVNVHHHPSINRKFSRNIVAIYSPQNMPINPKLLYEINQCVTYSYIAYFTCARIQNIQQIPNLGTI